jgi:hypothetical protein
VPTDDDLPTAIYATGNGPDALGAATVGTYSTVAEPMDHGFAQPVYAPVDAEKEAMLANPNQDQAKRPSSIVYSSAVYSSADGVENAAAAPLDGAYSISTRQKSVTSA